MLKRVTIDTYQVGLVFENRKLVDVIKEGSQWIFGNKEVMVYEKTLLFINGTYVKELAAGTHYFWNNSTSVEVKTADMRQQQLEISGQELLTKDKAGLRINFFVRYQVTEISKALVDNKDFEKQLYVLNITQLDLKKLIEAKTTNPLKELVNEINQISNEIADELLFKLRAIAAKGFVPALLQADTSIGRTLEKLLGIEMNSSRTPDYKGIELKSA